MDRDNGGCRQAVWHSGAGQSGAGFGRRRGPRAVGPPGRPAAPGPHCQSERLAHADRSGSGYAGHGAAPGTAAGAPARADAGDGVEPCRCAGAAGLHREYRRGRRPDRRRLSARRPARRHCRRPGRGAGPCRQPQLRLAGRGSARWPHAAGCAGAMVRGRYRCRCHAHCIGAGQGAGRPRHCRHPAGAGP